MEAVLKDREFYMASNGGVTCSGGECMLQIRFLRDFLSECTSAGIHTAVDTAGCVPWTYFEEILPYTKLFLYDLKCVSESLHISGTGKSNRLILENLVRLSAIDDLGVIIRIPVISGFNDSPEEIVKISEFLQIIHYSDIELLPYHRMGEHKYSALDRASESYEVPTPETMTLFQTLIMKKHIKAL